MRAPTTTSCSAMARPQCWIWVRTWIVGPYVKLCPRERGHAGGQEPRVHVPVGDVRAHLAEVVEAETAGSRGRHVGPEGVQWLADGGVVERVRAAVRGRRRRAGQVVAGRVPRSTTPFRRRPRRRGRRGHRRPRSRSRNRVRHRRWRRRRRRRRLATDARPRSSGARRHRGAGASSRRPSRRRANWARGPRSRPRRPSRTCGPRPPGRRRNRRGWRPSTAWIGLAIPTGGGSAVAVTDRVTGSWRPAPTVTTMAAHARTLDSAARLGRCTG